MSQGLRIMGISTPFSAIDIDLAAGKLKFELSFSVHSILFC